VSTTVAAVSTLSKTQLVIVTRLGSISAIFDKVNEGVQKLQLWYARATPEGGANISSSTQQGQMTTIEAATTEQV